MEPVVIQPPTRAFEDGGIAPGGRYTYQIQPLLPGRETAGVEIDAINTPSPITELTAVSPGFEPAATLRWKATLERGGEIVVSRRPQGAAENENKPISTLPVSAVEFTDRSAGAGASLTYSIAVTQCFRDF